jgi:hypothetical protein
MKFGKGLAGRIMAFIPVFFFIFSADGNCQYLKARDTQIVDASGNNIVLRGMGLGGWMLQEGYMLQIHNDGTQHSIKARISDLIGKENCDRFYTLWLENHMTRPDVDSLAKWGFNSIRLPMHYNLFTLPIEEEPVKGQNTWFTKGFELVDNLLSWCKANNIYLILDLHAAPGGQGKDSNISDYDESKPSLWESEENKLKTIALWRKLAERYANEPNIGGYDLVNEPNWTFEGKNRNGLEDTKNEPIWDLYQRITAAIREVDNNHIIIIEGNGWGNNYNGFIRPWDGNMVLSFHKYWNPNDQKSVSHITAAREKYNMPVWLGETGENSNTWFTDCITLLEKNNIGWSWWPLKKINSVVCPLMVVAPPEYKQISDYFNNEGPRPSVEMATRVLLTVAANTNAIKCRFNKDVIDAMFRQRKTSSTLRFSANQVPGTIQATDFDMGKQGFAYNDSEYDNTGQEGHKDGNKGEQYRNDGVDIIRSTDGDSKSNGYQVTSIENGEWLQYTIDVPKNGTFHVSARIASANSGGRFKVVFFEKPPVTNEEPPLASTGICTISATGSQTDWKTIETEEIKLDKGVYYMRVIIDRGGFELGWITIQ